VPFPRRRCPSRRYSASPRRLVRMPSDSPSPRFRYFGPRVRRAGHVGLQGLPRSELRPSALLTPALGAWPVWWEILLRRLGGVAARNLRAGFEKRKRNARDDLDFFGGEHSGGYGAAGNKYAARVYSDRVWVPRRSAPRQCASILPDHLPRQPTPSVRPIVTVFTALYAPEPTRP
jgi:hypothetical protein